jgi:hypothetical protein
VPDDGPSISYTVRDLVADLRAEIVALRTQMQQQLDRIEQQLARQADTKAEKTDLTALALRVKAVEDRDRERAARERVEEQHRRDSVDWRRWIWPTLIALAVVIIGVLQLVLK